MLTRLLAGLLVCAAARSASFIHLEVNDRADGGYQQQAQKYFFHHFLPLYQELLGLPYLENP